MPKPKLPAAERRSKQISIRATEDEIAKFKEQAKDAGFSQVSDYLRELVFSSSLELQIKRNKPVVDSLTKQLAESLLKSTWQQVKKRVDGI